MSIFTVLFWRAALERAVKSAAQGGILAFGAGQVDVLALDWATVAGFAGGAFVLSLLTSIASDAITGTGPSLTSAEVSAAVVVAQQAPDGTVVAGPGSWVQTGRTVEVEPTHLG